jgi:hypothetical protein
MQASGRLGSLKGCLLVLRLTWQYNPAAPFSKDTGLYQVPEHKPETQLPKKGGDTFLPLTLD